MNGKIHPILQAASSFWQLFPSLCRISLIWWNVTYRICYDVRAIAILFRKSLPVSGSSVRFPQCTFKLLIHFEFVQGAIASVFIFCTWVSSLLRAICWGNYLLFNVCFKCLSQMRWLQLCVPFWVLCSSPLWQVCLLFVFPFIHSFFLFFHCGSEYNS